MSDQPIYDRPQAQVILPQLGRGSATTGEGRTYYDRPMIKAPHWKWFIPLYFFLGGVAGGAALLGSLARFAGGERHRATVRHARYLALALGMVSPVLLILDLGRPKRFANMLRVVKVSSPLSLGTWILMSFGLTSGALAARQMADDEVLPRPLRLLTRLVPERLLTLTHGALGIGMGGYAGALLAATAVPLWSAAGILLAPLFMAASLMSGASALVLLGLRGPREARRDLQAVEMIAALTQLGLIATEERLTPESIGKSLREGRWGRVFRVG
ncbi:MAG TPA: NrfD/PsrC family molybdoenzyme membrane anchor subunit, partial [Ktedonobacterales bacterium]